MATKKKVMTTTRTRSGSRSAVLEVQDRREAPRLKLPRAEAEVVSLGLRATIIDVGFGGLSIESAREFRVGEVHTLRSGTSTADADILRAKVRHCRRDPAGRESARYVTGLEFVDSWCPGDGSAVDEFISQVTRGLTRAE
jgi:PilZ domain